MEQSALTGLNNTDVVFMVITCNKYRHRKKGFEEQLKKLGATYVFVYGDETIPFSSPLHLENTDYEHRQDECELHLRVSDSYEALTFKVQHALRAIADIEPFRRKYVVKIDDDVIIRDNNLLSRIIEHLFVNNIDYAGNIGTGGDRRWHFGKCSDPQVNSTAYELEFCAYAMGPMYFLSPRSVTILNEEFLGYLLNRDVTIYKEFYEDVYTGRTLLKRGIQVHGYQHLLRTVVHHQ